MDLEQKKEALVIHFFKTCTNNTVPEIAQKLQLKQYTVHHIINKYLNKKRT